MKTRIHLLSLLAFPALLSLPSAHALTFVGTNAPGAGTNFTFTTGAGATNLSLVVSNTAAAYSYLLVKFGGTPSDTVFDFAARLTGQTNEINLEVPEYADGSYGLRVSTPAGSTPHAFSAVLTTNRTDLRSAGYPVLKPLVFSVTSPLTNSGTGAWHYFQVDVPSNLLSGWRIVLSSSAGANPDLYLRRNSLPSQYGYDKISYGQSIDTLTYFSGEATTGTYFIGVFLPPGPATNTIYTLTTELVALRSLTWDPGTADTGTQVFTNQSASGGDYYFKITTQTPANQAWRSALKVSGGEADLYLLYGSVATPSSYSYSSTRVGSDGFVLGQGYHFNPGQDWYLTVHATPGAQWTLLTGEAYVQQLSPLAPDASSGATATIGPEGMRFFKTTITSNTLAWRLGLNVTNALLVSKTRAPLPIYTPGSGFQDWQQNQQMLLVPPYLNNGDQDLIGVVGNPGLTFTLDSRQQPVYDLAFNSQTNLSVTGYGYTTFRVPVPIQQIAWQINLTPVSGDPNLAVRRDNVPNEYVNDAFSELTGSVGDSVTLVPPTLSDGTAYITVYGAPPYSFSLANGQPIITDVNYIFQITNDAPARAGWRYYRVPNTAQQLGTYGWDLALSNQFPNTEIALRRNAVPGRWNYRNCSATCNYNSTLGYVDYSGTGGFLQRPGHQADIWYIGVYQPAAPLGNFTLTGQELTAAPLAFDPGSGTTANITNQPAGKWQYFIFNVPTNALGWDLRLTNVTSGNPQLTICRDRLPYDLYTHDYNGGGWYYPWSLTTWPSGYSWAAGFDWTGAYYNADGSIGYGRVLAMGMGNPLQPGTYYVGVLAGSGTTPLSYTLLSRGISTNGMAIGITDLAFSGGGALGGSLPAREADYYRIQITSNTPSWKVLLVATNAESLMLVQKDYLPNVSGSSYASTSVGGGRKMQKAGHEQYLLLPDTAAQTNIPPGTYYIAVVSEGQNPNGSTIGTNSSSYFLKSYGPTPTNQLGNLTPIGPDISLAQTLLGGEVKYYQFTVSPGVLAMEVRLDNRVGNPRMMLRPDGLLVQSYSTYGRDGGQYYQWYGDNVINVATPPAGTYTLSVQADYFNSGYSNAAYTVVVHPVTATPLGADGGTANVTSQTNGVWRYFQIDIATNFLGWDLRLTNVIGNPQLVICRDLAPNSLYSGAYAGYGWYYPWTYTTWPSSNQWGAGYDWTSDYYDPNGTVAYGRILQMGVGNPLEAGRYYAGVFSSTPSAPGFMSYTLVSRLIGTSRSIPIADLPFVGSVSVSNLPPREAAYYRVQVPPGAASWKLRLVATNSEAMMLVQKDYLPNVNGAGSSPVQIAGGRKLQKAGNEQFTLLPRSYPYEATLTNGTYYVAVVSEGMNPLGSTIGTNNSSFTLYSLGAAPTNQLGTVDPSGLTDITFNDSLEGTDFKFYRFAVPLGTLSLEVHLDNRVANPWMSLRADDDHPNPTDSISFSDGHGYTWQDAALINLAGPPVTNYTLCVQARYLSSGYSNATYTIRLHALGLTPVVPVVFDGGTNQVAGQAAGTWKYFTINVPSNAFGWDLRLTNITSGDPRLSIRRDTLPDSLYTHSDAGGGWYYPWTYGSWPTAYQWGVDYDWTSDYYNNNGSNSYGTVFQCGLGNPLSAGSYIVGVLNGSGTVPMAYTLVSRGIGTNLSIPILDLSFNGSVSFNGLTAREATYYKVTVPPNQPNWKLRLSSTTGESLTELQKDFLPCVYPGGTSPAQVAGGRRLQKAGNEHFLQLPQAGQSVIPGGTYYVAVVSEGQNPYSSRIGSNSCNLILTSYASLVYSNLGMLTLTETARTNSLEAGEIKVWQFTVPAAAAALEVRLTDKTGNSYQRLSLSSNAPSGNYSYGYDYGEYPTWSDAKIITIPSPAAGLYSLNVQADPATDADYVLRARLLSPADLAFDQTLSTPSLTNVVSGALADLQRTYFRVTVPATFNGQPVLGWKLNLDHAQGNPRLRVRKDLVPADQGYVGNSPYATDQAVIVPPFLTSGTWYVEVQGQGASQFTLTSSALLLERPAWQMPAIGQSVTTPGLPAAGPLFGDTGVSVTGTNLPGDQGVDLAQASFHYYAVTIPSNNLGIIRTRLDAISGNPDLYIRAGGAPTLSHYSVGDYGSTLYDRYLNANIGSEYGNWVPLNGRDELQLSPGTWYLAVLANGNSNVRYRLRCYTGTITPLAFDGVPIISQTIAAGDWRHYQVKLPTNCPVTWNVTFAQNLGDVVMYVRDTTPPGHGSYVTDYRDWNSDSKNHGQYPTVDPPGTTQLPCPPLRPGQTYYLGFRAVNDATFSVSCTTNTATIDYTNTVAFYGGYISNTIPPNGTLKLRVDVPGDARRMILNTTNASTVAVYIDQGSVPTPAAYHYPWSGTYSFNVALYGNSWPWYPGYMYFLLVTNTSSSAQSFVMGSNGKNAATDDADGDGLPDAWELACWPSIYSYDGNGDPDVDGVNNMEEYLEGTSPCDPNSFHPRLLTTSVGGSVSRNPVGNTTLTPPKVWYLQGASVQLTANGDPGYSFVNWSGSASGTANPLNLTMNAHKNVTANFAVTNSSGADYQFQFNLNSSTGSPPALQNIGAGNVFSTENVDGCPRTVLTFPVGNGVRLQPTTGVIPTNVYTIAMLFRLDAVSGWRRLLDFKAGTTDLGLYCYSGQLYFYISAVGPTGAILAGQYVQVVLTRDGTGQVTGYVNGVQQFTFNDAAGNAVISSANDLRFFKDDGGDNGSGALARIRLYNLPMPPGQIALLDRTSCAGAPHFLTPWFGVNQVLNLPVEHVVPGVTYRLLASTNLVNWLGIVTNTPLADPALFQDVQAANYPNRFYRLVTP